MTAVSRAQKRMQKGSALTEFVIVAGVLVPAMLAMPMLGKLADARHTTVQANRYAVWEKTVGGDGQKTDEQLSREVKTRFLSSPDSAILSDDQEIESVNPYWVSADMEGDAALLGNAVISSANHDIPGDLGAEYIAKAMVTLGDVMDGPIKGANWDVEEKGFYTVNMQMEMATNSLVAKGEDCAGAESDSVAGCLNVVGAIFTDEWDARSRDHVESRTRSMVPAGALGDVADVVSYLGAIPLFRELKHLKDVFGTVSPDVLPPDRYGEL